MKWEKPLRIGLVINDVPGADLFVVWGTSTCTSRETNKRV
jgi:hypothetical protein